MAADRALPVGMEVAAGVAMKVVVAEAAEVLLPLAARCGRSLWPLAACCGRWPA